MSTPLDWQYTGPVPPTPMVVSTVPTYYADLPTPPSTPGAYSTVTVDDDASCPATPYVFPSDAQREEIEWQNALNDVDSRLSSPGRSLAEKRSHSTAFADPLTEIGSNQSFDDPPSPHLSDCLIYAYSLYAYPSPILAMIERAALDQRGLKDQRVNPQRCGQPFKLFSITAGVVPITGFKELDDQTFDYYLVLDPFLLTPPESSTSFTFSIGTIRGLQYDLSRLWHAVYPQPIPPVIIRAADLITPHTVRRRADGCAYVVPDEGSIWDTVCRRGVDATFRPMDPTAEIETKLCLNGGAIYYPQHIVASKFAVNVFMELPDSDRLSPRCEYLGAYVLQVMRGVTMDDLAWAKIDPKIRKSVFDRVPNLFNESRAPDLPYIKFCYYHWDPCVVKLANRTLKIHQDGQGTA